MSYGLTASAVVSLATAAGDAQHLSAEIDSREDGLNGGASVFLSSSQPAFLVYATVPFSVEASAGSVQAAGTVSVPVEEDVVHYFWPDALEHEVTLSRPVVGVPTLVTELGTNVSLEIASTYQDGSVRSVVLRAAAAGWCIAKVQGHARALAYRVTPPPEWKTALPQDARILLLAREVRT